jgi:HK97 family phage prohead protease
MNEREQRATEVAARQRATGGIHQRGDRPSQRRSAETPGTRATVRGALAGVSVRAAADTGGLTFEGHASVTERSYQMWDFFGPYSEVVSAGAFDETLARAGLDVPLVLGHDQMRRIARTTNGTLNLSMDADGLAVMAELDADDVDVQYIAPKLRSGLIDEMSFAFRIDAGTWSPDYSEYRIDKVDIHRGDVAIVGYGANPHTDGGVRSKNDTKARAMLALAVALG